MDHTPPTTTLVDASRAASRADSSVHVLYIAGAGRSGSTLLSNVLGQLPGAVSVGELYYLWERGLEDNSLCGCGTPVRQCAFWGRVLERARQAADVDDIGSALRAGVAGARTRHLLNMLTQTGRHDFVARSQPFLHVLQHLYAAIRDETGCDYIIDASKFPTYGYLLTAVPTLSVSVIHLIRDARAVGFSWQRQKYNPDSDALFGRISSLRSALIWDAWNLGAELLGRTLPAGRYYRLHYETFIQRPDETLADIIALGGLEARPTDVIDDGMVTMRQAHTIGGNPVRFQRSMRLRLDTEWQRAMPLAPRALTTTLTWPLLRRYHYPLKGEPA